VDNDGDDFSRVRKTNRVAMKMCQEGVFQLERKKQKEIETSLIFMAIAPESIRIRYSRQLSRSGVYRRRRE